MSGKGMEETAPADAAGAVDAAEAASGAATSDATLDTSENEKVAEAAADVIESTSDEATKKEKAEEKVKVAEAAVVETAMAEEVDMEVKDPEPTDLEPPEKQSLHAMPELLSNDADDVDMDDDDVDFGGLTIEEALTKLATSREGLTSAEAAVRLEQYGPNALPEVDINKCAQFLSFMWNPLSWVMEIAALVAIALSNGPQPYLFPNSQWAPFNSGIPDPATSNPPPDYPDFIGIVFLLLANSAIGYYEEAAAGDAVAALMEQLSTECKAKRDGKWETIKATLLVPGDICTIKLGDIVPADLKLLDGEPLKVDQAGLTGESLPVTKEAGDEVYSSSVVKRGEIDCVVHATGINTFFGKAASLVSETQEHGHLQQVLSAIGTFCLVYITIWVIVLALVLPLAYTWFYRGVINLILVILIGGIPIAMPTVLSVTMALGVNELAKKNAIVTRITAVEEMAGMDVLCSDKTGTLTLNQLTVDTPTTCGEFTPEAVILAAALAAKREGDPDAIDKCIHDTAVEKGLDFSVWQEVRFVPFNPTDKRTEATLKRADDASVLYMCSKGAPQVMIDLAWNADAIREEQEVVINNLALRGLRAIGVAEKKGGPDDEDAKWEFMGLIPLLDPPRHDTKATIEAAQRLGVSVKMITGDQVAIGKETARRLGMGLNFHAAKVVRSEFVQGIPIGTIVEEADGFGEVLPEDKYRVVEILRHLNNGPNGGVHVVGMTGDGVNDAPALKVSDVGIAVHGATDAARAAADMVLLTPGLNVIIDAILGSRKIFQRMKNYAMYACATTIRIVSTFGLMAVIWQFSFPPLLTLLLAILNDGTILTISKDNASPSPTPDAWRLKEIFSVGSALGVYLTISTLVFFTVIIDTDFFDELTSSPPEQLIKSDDLCFYYENAQTQQNAVDLGVCAAVGDACLATLRDSVPSFAGLEQFRFDPINDCLSAYQETYGFNEIGRRTNSAIYLQVSITGQIVIFSTRSRTFFWQGEKPGLALVAAFFTAQLIVSLIAGLADWPFTAIFPTGAGWVAIVWVWSILWALPLDLVKISVSWLMYGNPWAHVAQQRQMFNMAINGGGSNLGSRAGTRKAPNSRAYAAASHKRAVARASRAGR